MDNGLKINRRTALSVAVTGSVLARSTSADALPDKPKLNGGHGPNSHVQTALVLQPGVYHAADIPLRGSHIRVVAAIPETVSIIIPDGMYFLDTDDFIMALYFEGIHFKGGAGVVRLRRTAQNVATTFVFNRCDFMGYTVCAISNNSDNQPWLRVSDCRFRSAKGALAIGIAWGGYVDSTLIERTTFLANRYHLKIGPRISGTCWIRNCDFMMPVEEGLRADIWFVPNNDEGGRNSGFGSTVENCRFGNETLKSGSPRIIVAHEDNASGLDRGTRTHSTNFNSIGFVSGITLSGNRIESRDSANVSFMISYISNLNWMTWFNNKFDGGNLNYAVEFIGTEKELPLSWNVHLSAGDGPSLPQNGFTNIKFNGSDHPWWRFKK